MLLRMVLRGLANSRGGSQKKAKPRKVYHGGLLGGWQCKHRHTSMASARRCAERELRRRRRR